jgi:hypothetical protein
MKAAAMIVLAGACVAQGQVNRGFETGDFSGYNVYVPNANTSVVTQTTGGLPAFVGTYCARLVAGDLSQEVAEQSLDLAPGRLAKLYKDLGGEGLETGGDYNILRANLPPCDYYFWWTYEHGDKDDPTYLDHAFVVNGRGEITVLADGVGGNQGDFWHNMSFEHPGGPIYFVVANGSDDAFSPVLYVDDTQRFDGTNPSFESGLANWNIEDAGANHALTLSQTGLGGKSPTDGNLMAQVNAGEMTQVAANNFLKLNPDALADLYADIGGQGDFAGGDYAILWQEMPVGDVSFDWLVEGGDVHELDFADHAFAMNGAGEIEVFYNSLNGPSTNWTTTTMSHPGGKFYVVIANGGDDGIDPQMYVDNFRRGSKSVDSGFVWDAEGGAGVEWGDGDVETFGQTFVAADTSLTSMTFFVDDQGADQIEFEAYVYAFDGQKAVGDAVFASGKLTTDGVSNGFEPVVVPTPGARLEKDEVYIAFLTVSKTMPTGAGARVGFTGTNWIAGHFMYNDNGANFGQLFSTGWASPFADLACRFEFGHAGKTTAPTIYDNVYAGNANSWPWNAGGAFRYQQIFRADQLDGAGTLDKFYYRANPTVGQKFTDKAISCQIFLGHTDREAWNMSPTFDANFTDDKVLVVDGAVVISSSGHGGFDIEVNVADAFEYNGKDNLIMEIAIPDASNTGVGSFDAGTAQLSGAGAGATPWSNRLSAFGANAVTGSIDKWDGLATRFEFLEPAVPCYADCDENGSLNILDFVCYQFIFEQGDQRADCNEDGQLNILDFVCYQGKFESGCL